jgi:hypothetical protein
MNRIIEKLSSNEFVRVGARNQISAGIATIDGSIWIVFRSRKVFKRPIISRDQNIPIHTPVVALNALERGPTGGHDMFVSGAESALHLLYCHQSVCELKGEGIASLCGRTFVVNTDIDCEEDSGEDESLEYELKNGEHLRITSGTVRVRVSAGGHRVYMGSGVMGTAANYQIFK